VGETKKQLRAEDIGSKVDQLLEGIDLRELQGGGGDPGGDYRRAPVFVIVGDNNTINVPSACAGCARAPRVVEVPTIQGVGLSS
jgi:hypothetical protein